MYFSVVYSVHFSDCVSSYNVLLWRAYFLQKSVIRGVSRYKKIGIYLRVEYLIEKLIAVPTQTQVSIDKSLCWEWFFFFLNMNVLFSYSSESDGLLALPLHNLLCVLLFCAFISVKVSHWMRVREYVWLI